MFYQHDNTLGDTGTQRSVVLRGTTTVSQLFSPNIFDIPGWVETALESAGFNVVAVRMSAAGYIGYSNNLEIELSVDTAYTADQARANAIIAIENYTANWGLNKVFFNTTLSVASDAYVPPSTGGGGYTYTPVTTANPPSIYNQQPGANGNNSQSNFLDNLGLGLGVSTPVVLGAAALLLVLTLKR